MSIFLAMFGFSLAMSISPGPVNLTIIASGANYGLRETMPFVSGATIGFTLLLAAIGFGLYGFMLIYPTFLEYLAIAGAGYIVFMGYKVSRDSGEIDIPERIKPRFYDGFLLQWLNPKAWIACVSGVAIFSSPETNSSLINFIIVYFFVCYGSLTIWAVAGDKIRMILSTRQRMNIFNKVMGSILIASALYLLYLQFSN